MSLLSRIFRRRVVPAATERLREATTPNSADIPENDHLWRSLSVKTRDLDPIQQDRVREVALWLRQNNGFAKRYEEILTDFTAGEEPYAKAENDDLQDVLDAFWDDPVNGLRVFGRQLAGQLRTIGEQCVTLHHRNSDGRLRLGYLPPEVIDCVRTMPGNPRHLVEVWTKKDAAGERTVWRIVLPGEKIEDVYQNARSGALLPRPAEIRADDPSGEQGRVKYDGACMYFDVNRLSDATRGVSDLFAPADYLDGLDKTTFNSVERSELLNRIGFDVRVEGESDQKKLREIGDEFRAANSKNGGAWTHNEKVTATAWSADLKSSDMEALVRIAKNHILATWGFPEAWFGSGSETNLATLGEQGTPTIRKLKSAQTTVRMMLRALADWQIQLKLALTSELAGVDEDDLANWDIVLPQITGKDTSRDAAVLAQITGALSAAVAEEFCTHKSAALIWQDQVGSMYGFEFRPEDMDLLDAVEEKEQQRLEEPEPRPGLMPPGPPQPGEEDGEQDGEEEDPEDEEETE